MGGALISNPLKRVETRSVVFAAAVCRTSAGVSPERPYLMLKLMLMGGIEIAV